MAKKKPTTKSKKDNKKKRKILLATLIPVGALVAATAITVPLVLANRNKGNEDDPIAYKKAVVLRNTGNVKGIVTLCRPHGEGEEIKQYQANLQYSTDGKNWTTPTYTYTEWEGFEKCSCDIEPNATLFIKGDNNAMVYWDEQHNQYQNRITITQQGEWSQENHASIELSGSIMGLINDGGAKPKPDWTMPNSCFQSVFCVEEEEAVPALTFVSKDFLSSEQIVNKLSENCFTCLFYGCLHLKNSPNLPSTKLANMCYADMFNMGDDKISDFDTPPELPAEELKPVCYSGMFYGCSSLKEAPKLPAKELANNCYFAMFYGCVSLKQAPALPASTLYPSCYQKMFSGCTSLKIIEGGEEFTTHKKIFTCPDLQAVLEVEDMFSNTKDHSGEWTPEENKTYYYEV